VVVAPVFLGTITKDELLVGQLAIAVEVGFNHGFVHNLLQLHIIQVGPHLWLVADGCVLCCCISTTQVGGLMGCAWQA